jgi:hypothetical protein
MTNSPASDLAGRLEAHANELIGRSALNKLLREAATLIRSDHAELVRYGGVIMDLEHEVARLQGLIRSLDGEKEASHASGFKLPYEYDHEALSPAEREELYKVSKVVCDEETDCIWKTKQDGPPPGHCGTCTTIAHAALTVAKASAAPPAPGAGVPRPLTTDERDLIERAHMKGAEVIADIGRLPVGSTPSTPDLEGAVTLEALIELPSLIGTNIQEVAGWQDNANLITAMAHAYVLKTDLPVILSSLNTLRARGESSALAYRTSYELGTQWRTRAETAEAKVKELEAKYDVLAERAGDLHLSLTARDTRIAELEAKLPHDPVRCVACGEVVRGRCGSDCELQALSTTGAGT